MISGNAILRTVVRNAQLPDAESDDYGIAWYRGMISAAQQDDEISALLLEMANQAVDKLRARRVA